MYPIPRFGFMVVNGRLAISTGVSVAAEKKVDLPVFGFPTTPTINALNFPSKM
jgi:hypothetical protein